MNILIITFNVGSSSLKIATYLQDNKLFSLNIDFKQQLVSCNGTLRLHDWLPKYDLVTDACSLIKAIQKHYTTTRIVIAHRIVHGGEYSQPMYITSTVLENLKKLASLCPLHQPAALAVIEAIISHWPDIQQVAAFDTAFHAQQSTLARSFALPLTLREQGIKRYGFHGLSCQSIMQQLSTIHKDKG